MLDIGLFKRRKPNASALRILKCIMIQVSRVIDLCLPSVHTLSLSDIIDVFVLSPSLFVMHPPPSQTCRHVNVFRYHRSSSACSDSDSTVHWRPLRATGPQWCLSGWGVQGLFDQSRLRRWKRQAGMSARRGVRFRVHAVCVCVAHLFHHSLTRSPVLLLEKGCPLQVSWSYCLILTIFNASLFFSLP